jgi:hypothetical protein
MTMLDPEAARGWRRAAADFLRGAGAEVFDPAMRPEGHDREIVSRDVEALDNSRVLLVRAIEPPARSPANRRSHDLVGPIHPAL